MSKVNVHKLNCIHCAIGDICPKNLPFNQSNDCNYFVHKCSPVEWIKKMKQRFLLVIGNGKIIP
jgi:hypothetical protein